MVDDVNVVCKATRERATPVSKTETMTPASSRLSDGESGGHGDMNCHGTCGWCGEATRQEYFGIVPGAIEC